MASGIIDRALLDFDAAPEASSFRQLFGVWKGLHDKLSAAARAGDTTTADALLDAQTHLMSLAAHLPAKSLEDVLFKLAFWRWDANDLDSDFASLQRGDQIVYSVFRDLAALTGEREVLTEGDVQSNYFSRTEKPD